MLNIQDLIAKYDKKVADLKAKAVALKNVKEIDKYDYINELNRINTATKELDESRFAIDAKDCELCGIPEGSALTVKEMKEHISYLTSVITSNGVNTKVITDKTYDSLIQNQTMDDALDNLYDLTQSSLTARDQRSRFLMVIPLGETSAQLASVEDLEVNETTQQITWSPVEDATHYIVKLVHVATKKTKTITIDDTMLSLSNLANIGTYKISVIASAPGNSEVFNSSPTEITYTV